jgi:dinuclear metal center YbgI/SA1388 family protein
VADRDAIVAFLNELLDVGRYPDGMPIGMQVPGAGQVTHVATGVSASLELFERAAAAGAEMLIVHHGLFYGSGPRPAMTAREKARLKALFDADLSLLAYHLCLDAHPQVGNNAVICDLLGLHGRQPFGEHGTHTLGFLAEPEAPLTIDRLVELVRAQITPQPLVFRDGPDAIERVAVISGAAAKYAADAAAAGAGCFVTGEPNEQAMWEAREAGVNFIAAGHNATEVFGVRALGELLAQRFGVSHTFVDIPNPV